MLVVDDDALLCWAIVQTLTAAGYDVVSARPPAAARHALAGGLDLNVALIEASRAVPSGLDLLRLLRQRAPQCAVILMAVVVTPDVTRLAQRFGARAVLCKPFDMHGLVATVFQVCRQPRN